MGKEDNMEKVLITGGSGFIGSHVADKFIKNNYEVIVVDNLVTGKYENINGKKLTFINEDIRDIKNLEKIFLDNKISYVIHMAAQVSVSASVEDIKYDAEENIIGFINVLELSKKYNIKKVLFSSTAAVYGIPVIFGPKYQKFKEARDLLQVGGAFSITDEKTFESKMEELSTYRDLLEAAGVAAGDFVKSNIGATNRIIASIPL